MCRVHRMGHAAFVGVLAQYETGWASRLLWRMRRGPKDFITGLPPDIAGMKGSLQFSRILSAHSAMSMSIALQARLRRRRLL